jgi:hypothetical protein
MYSIVDPTTVTTTAATRQRRWKNIKIQGRVEKKKGIKKIKTEQEEKETKRCVTARG